MTSETHPGQHCSSQILPLEPKELWEGGSGIPEPPPKAFPPFQPLGLALGNGQIKGSQTAGKKGKRVSPMRTGGLGRVAARGGQQVTLTRGDIAQGLSDSPSEADRRQA